MKRDQRIGLTPRRYRTSATAYAARSIASTGARRGGRCGTEDRRIVRTDQKHRYMCTQHQGGGRVGDQLTVIAAQVVQPHTQGFNRYTLQPRPCS